MVKIFKSSLRKSLYHNVLLMARTYTSCKTVVRLNVSEVPVGEKARLGLVKVDASIENTLLLLIIHTYHA